MTKLKSKTTKKTLEMQLEMLYVASLLEAKFNGQAAVVLLARREGRDTTFGTDADIEERVLEDYPFTIKKAIFGIVGLNCSNTFDNWTKVKDTPYFKIIISKSTEKPWFDFEFTTKKEVNSELCYMVVDAECRKCNKLLRPHSITVHVDMSHPIHLCPTH
jgi:hypothetical protein